MLNYHSLSRKTVNAGLAQPVERLIRNHEVASSNLASSSQKTSLFRMETWRFFALYSVILYFSSITKITEKSVKKLQVQ